MTEQPTRDATMLTVMALIRALHDHGILPAQATADVLDRRAINASLRGQNGADEQLVQQLAVALQQWADLAESQHPFAPRDPGTPTRS
jgi:hypothetical protein